MSLRLLGLVCAATIVALCMRAQMVLCARGVRCARVRGDLSGLAS